MCVCVCVCACVCVYTNVCFEYFKYIIVSQHLWLSKFKSPHAIHTSRSYLISYWMFCKHWCINYGYSLLVKVDIEENKANGNNGMSQSLVKKLCVLGHAWCFVYSYSIFLKCASIYFYCYIYVYIYIYIYIYINITIDMIMRG